MSARIPPGYAEFAMKFQLGGDPEPAFCFLGLIVAEPGNQGNTNDIDLAFQLALDSLVTNDWSLGGGWVTWGQDGESDIRIDSLNDPVVGLVNGDSAVQNTCLLVRKTSALGGRRNRGRMFIPGINRDSWTVVGRLSPVNLAAFQVIIDALEANLLNLASVTGFALFHETAPFTPTTVTGFVVQPIAATQRRRLRP